MNRKKLPRKINIPDTPKLQKNKFVVNAERSLANFDIEFIGESNNFLYPTNFEEADEWLNDFFKHRFFLFGDYEDAISKENSFLWHSLLSPLLNSGLLTPDEVVNKALLFAKNNNVPINSLEGFIRQLLDGENLFALFIKSMEQRCEIVIFGILKISQFQNLFIKEIQELNQ